MGLLSKAKNDVSADGLVGANRAIYRTVRAGLGTILQYFGPAGTNIFEYEWDMLIVLDACRPDLMSEVSAEYSFVEDQETIWSVGTATPEWIENTFTEAYTQPISETSYITGNPFSDELESQNFCLLDEVWRDVWDDDTNTIPARPITNHAIHTARSEDPARLLVHYMQPHATFIPNTEVSGSGNQDSIWMALREGDFDKATVWNAYRNNLRYVLDDVAVLLKNVDAETVVITSDHGNAFGEYGVYGHPSGYPIASLRKVPWIETSATDEKSHDPEIKDGSVERDITQQLNDLGYVTD